MIIILDLTVSRLLSGIARRRASAGWYTIMLLPVFGCTSIIWLVCEIYCRSDDQYQYKQSGHNYFVFLLHALTIAAEGEVWRRIVRSIYFLCPMIEPFYRYNLLDNSWLGRWFVVQTSDNEDEDLAQDIREIRELLENEE